MKSKEETLIMEEEKILQRRNEYTKKRKEINLQYIKTWKSDVNLAAVRMNRNKAPGPNGILL